MAIEMPPPCSSQAVGDDSNTKNRTESESATRTETAQTEVSTKRKSSDAWLHFTKTELGNKVSCNHCTKLVGCRSERGSSASSMLKHIVIFPKLRLQAVDDEVDGKKFKQTTLHFHGNKDGSATSVPSYLTFDQELCRRASVRLIVKAELPFRFGEQDDFREYMSVVQPRFIVPSCRTVTRDCMALFIEEMNKLKGFFKKFGVVFLLLQIHDISAKSKLHVFNGSFH